MRTLLNLLLILISVSFFSSCSSEDDPCENIVCENGNCINGLCDCDLGWEGIDCSTRSIPKSVTITRVNISNIPSFKPSGDNWDLLDAPDVFVSIYINRVPQFPETSSFGDFSSTEISNFSGNSLTANFNVELQSDEIEIIYIVLKDKDFSLNDIMDYNVLNTSYPEIASQSNSSIKIGALAGSTIEVISTVKY